MKSLKQKIFNKNLLASLPLALILLLAIGGCSSSGKNQPKPTDTFCDKYFRAKKSEKFRSDIQKVSDETFEYFKINETTAECDCPASKSETEKRLCYADFLKLK